MGQIPKWIILGVIVISFGSSCAKENNPLSGSAPPATSVDIAATAARGNPDAVTANANQDTSANGSENGSESGDATGGSHTATGTGSDARSTGAHTLIVAGPRPLHVATEAPHIRAVASGAEHTLALMSDGTVWAWGSNGNGQLGDGTTADQLSPIDWRPIPHRITSLAGAQSIAAGYYHSLALMNDGTVWSWGQNPVGELGRVTASTLGDATPAPIPGLTHVTAIAAGINHSLALKDDGTVWAWGSNQDGEMGMGAGAPGSVTPLQIPGLTGITDIASGGQHSLAVRSSDGLVWAWGDNSAGQVGDGTSVNHRPSPVLVHMPAGVRVIRVAAGEYHSLALTFVGTVYAWGLGTNGQLGLGPSGAGVHASPTNISSLFSISQIAAGPFHSLAWRSTDRALLAWGDNSAGELGDGTHTNILFPTHVAVTLHDIVQLSPTHGNQNFIVTQTREIWGWGDDEYGQLGDGVAGGNRSTPERIFTTSGPVATAE